MVRFIVKAAAPVNARFPLQTAPITFLSLINKGFQRPELIELIEQEGATRFFNKYEGGKGPNVRLGGHECPVKGA
jgi:hypothetical protein